MSIFNNRRFSSARKFLLHRLDDSDDESSNIEWELPSRRRFISLTPADLLNTNSSFCTKQMKQNEVKIDTSPLIVDETKAEGFEQTSPQFPQSDQNVTEKITQHNRYSFLNTKSDQLTDKTIQKIFEEQQKMREQMQEQFKQFNEYKEIETMEQQMNQIQETKAKQQDELKQIESQKEEERKQNLDQLEAQKQIELDQIKQIISEEFVKRNDELLRKQQEIERLKQTLIDKMKDKDDVNIALQQQASENETIIKQLKSKVSELREDGETNTKEIALAETTIEDVAMKQEEILKEISDNIELHQTLEHEQKELEQNEVELKQKQEDLESEKDKEIKKRSKNAYKKFDILRANIMMESEIEFKHIREKRSLLDVGDIMDMMKLKMKRQFKEQMMRLRVQLNDNNAKSVQLPYTKIDRSFFGDDAGAIVFAASPNSEMCACLGANGIFHVIDIRTAEDLYLGSLKGIICNYDTNVMENEIESVKVVHMEWDKEGMLMALLLDGCTWIGIWNSLTKQFYELSVDECEDKISAFGWSHNTLLFGMDKGDIYIKNMYKEESELIMIKNKMFDAIDLCTWSVDHTCAIIVNETHIAIVNDVGVTTERIASKQAVIDLKCGYVNDKNVLSILSGNSLIVHGVNDAVTRKLMTFDTNCGSIIKQCWCHDSIIIAFEGGNLVVMNAKTYSNKHVECGTSIQDMDAIHLPNVGYIIAIIDDECVRFLKFIDDIDDADQWTPIAVINYKDSEWIVEDEIPIAVQLTQNGNHSIVCFVFCLTNQNAIACT
eukprot:464005_1